MLVACGILDAERQALMNSGFGFNEILKVRMENVLELGSLSLNVPDNTGMSHSLFPLSKKATKSTIRGMFIGKCSVALTPSYACA